MGRARLEICPRRPDREPQKQLAFCFFYLGTDGMRRGAEERNQIRKVLEQWSSKVKAARIKPQRVVLSIEGEASAKYGPFDGTHTPPTPPPHT